MKKILPLSVALIALLLLATCEREWSNPFDPNNTLDPETWAPENLYIANTGITVCRLTWTYVGPANIQGFKVDRKKGDEAWQVALAALPKETRTWNDTTLIPQTGLTYQYRIYTYAGNNSSAEKSATVSAAIPAPNNLTISRNTINSVTLNWQGNSTGEDGFKIQRKYENGDWVEVAATTGTTWQNNDFDLNTMVYYRVNAYYTQYSSVWVENSFNSTIPPPENLTITANSATSVTLNWNYSLTGHEGFKIERKIDNGSWEILEDNLNPNKNNFVDNGLDLNSYTYHYRVYAYFTDYYSIKPEQSITFIFDCGTKFTDTRDGNEYETVQIGNQCWMKENLKWLPGVNPSANGSNESAYYYVYGYQGTSVSAAINTINYQTYGVLYNWLAAIDACPDGWHLPSDDEWTVLVDFLGGSNVAGGKMKTTSTTHWSSPNTGATNSSGFSGLPGGYRYYHGNFDGLGSGGGWWSSTDYFSVYPWYRILGNNHASANRDYNSKELGLSVRCLKD